jgi:hypothetical protein
MVRFLRDDEYQRQRANQERWVKMLESRFAKRQQELAELSRSKQSSESLAQAAAEQRRRDKQQHLFGMQATDQRAALASMAADKDNRNQIARDKLQQKNLLKRDEAEGKRTTERDRQQARLQQMRDAQQFGYSQQETEQDFQNQIQRDAFQQGYTLDRDRLQQQNTLQRDMLQGGIQADRDKRLNTFDVNQQMLQQRNLLERDTLQNQFQSERDARLNIFDTQRDVRRQQFEQQNRYQQEIADVSARWQEQVNAAKSAGLDFSPQQQKEMQDLDRAFRKNILNGDFPEDVKLRAMLEHQKKLAAFIPEQKVVTDQQQFSQSIVVDEATGARYLAIRDPRGGVKYEPVQQPGMQDTGELRYQEQAAQRQQEATRKAMLQREDEYQGLVDRLASETDAEMNPKYSSAEDVKKEAMKRFARKEQVYREHYGLPPVAPFQEEADQIRAAQEAAAKKPQNPYRAILQQQSSGQTPVSGPNAPMAQSVPIQAPQLSKPEIDEEILRKRNSQQNTGSAVELSSSNLADQINAAKKSGNNEAVKALNTIDQLTRKLGGRTPEEGSEEMELLIEALKVIRKNGYSVQPKAAPVTEPSAFFDGGMAFPG